ncbi:hypothetical protein GQ42DRAFT_179460 [Ramicandelaber brevisporus]|nr:hypothetical protein GQ42DRAFT_179460 [Ramicandelaber brevisporus]
MPQQQHKVKRGVQDLATVNNSPFSRNFIPPQPIKAMLSNLKILHDNAKPGQKSSILACLVPLGRETLEEIGFIFSSNQYSLASEKVNAANFPLELNSPPSRRPADYQQKIDTMRKFVCDNSRITVHKNAKDDAIFVYNGTKTEMYNLYAAAHGDRALKRTVFFKNWPSNCCPARSKSDLCTQCEIAKKLESQQRTINSKIASLEARLNANENDDTTRGQISRQIEQQQTLMNQLQSQLNLATIHRRDVEVQHSEYKNQMENPLPGQAVVTLDYKQNWAVGVGDRETSHDYYSRDQVSHLGAVVVKLVDGRPKRFAFNIFSNILSHDARFTRDGIDILMQHEILQDVDKVSFWFDCAGHFRCGEVLYHTLFTLPAQRPGLKVVVQYHAEQHGKGPVDGLFGTLSAWFNIARQSRSIATLDNIKEVFEEKLKAAKEANEKAIQEAANNPANPIPKLSAFHSDNVFQIVYERQDRDSTSDRIKRLKFEGVRQYLKYTRCTDAPPSPSPPVAAAPAPVPAGRGRRPNAAPAPSVDLLGHHRSNAEGLRINAALEDVADTRKDKRAPVRNQADDDGTGISGFTSQVSTVLRIRGGLNRTPTQPAEPARRRRTPAAPARPPAAPRRRGRSPRSAAAPAAPPAAPAAPKRRGRPPRSAAAPAAPPAAPKRRGRPPKRQVEASNIAGTE